MCVYSMIMDHYLDKWKEQEKKWDIPINPSITSTPFITPAEIAEFRELLRKAKEYDRKHNEPDCELEEKKKILKDLADKLGVKIEFP